MKATNHKATPEHEAFYQDAIDGVRAAIDRHPNIRTLEVLAVLGRAAGYAVAMCNPDERDLATATVMENLKIALADVGAPGPDRPGVNQR